MKNLYKSIHDNREVHLQHFIILYQCFPSIVKIFNNRFHIVKILLLQYENSLCNHLNLASISLINLALYFLHVHQNHLQIMHLVKHLLIFAILEYSHIKSKSYKIYKYMLY